MSFRTVIIKNRVKMEYSLNYLVCRGEKEIKINLDEISLLIIQNVSSSITVSLMSKLVEKKIGVIVCDEKNNPQFQFMPYHSVYNSYAKIKKQISWDETTKSVLWMEIIRHKILYQAKLLKSMDKVAYTKLLEYMTEIAPGDISNREGHAAKVYFNALFGKDFSRNDDSIQINKYLNYGYSNILSAVNREIVSFGYLTQLGIHHIGEANPYNLSCDFMEPLRPFVDKLAISQDINEINFKDKMIFLLNRKCYYNGKEMFLDNAIHLYIQNLLTYLNTGEIEKVKFIEYEP